MSTGEEHGFGPVNFWKMSITPSFSLTKTLDIDFNLYSRSIRNYIRTVIRVLVSSS